MEPLIKPNEKLLYRVYFCVMAVLLLAIEAAQLTCPDPVTGFLKTLPAVFTAAMGIRFICVNGVPKQHDRFLAAAVIAVGAADILLCFFVVVVPILSQVPGFLAFCVMELLIMLWLGLNAKSILLHVAALMVLLGAGIMAHRTDLYSIAALTNLGLLLGNLIQGAVQCHRSRTRTARLYLLSAVGIAVCDYSIMIRTVFHSALLRGIATELAWAGYVPFLALLLLTLVSACRNE